MTISIVTQIRTVRDVYSTIMYISEMQNSLIKFLKGIIMDF